MLHWLGCKLPMKQIFSWCVYWYCDHKGLLWTAAVDRHLYLQNICTCFIFLNILLAYTKCKLVCYPLKGLFSRPDIVMQSGTEVTWLLMSSILPPAPCDFCTTLYDVRGTRRIWLRDCATSRKVAGSIPYGVIGIFRFSGCTMVLGLTQPLTGMSTRNVYWG
jgi:hypothetical protein